MSTHTNALIMTGNDFCKAESFITENGSFYEHLHVLYPFYLYMGMGIHVQGGRGESY